MHQGALFLTKAQGALEVSDRPIPKPGPGELLVLVKVHLTALNLVDWKIQSERLPGLRTLIGWDQKHDEKARVLAYNVCITVYPALLGRDAIGIVEEIGKGILGFAKATWTKCKLDNKY